MNFTLYTDKSKKIHKIIFIFFAVCSYFFCLNLFAQSDKINTDYSIDNIINYENFLKKIPTNIIVPQGRKQFQLSLKDDSGYADLQIPELLEKLQDGWHRSEYLLANAEMLSFKKQAEKNQIFSHSLRIERFRGKISGNNYQVRELVTLLSPEKLAPTYYLTIRPEKKTLPEFFWHSSKLSGIASRLDSVVRDEKFPISNTFSLNDLFGFSKRSTDITVQSEDRISAKVLYFQHKQKTASSINSKIGEKEVKKKNSVDGCKKYLIDISIDSFPLAPKVAIRDVIKITLLSNSPFSSVGKQVLYIDEQALIPVYQEVYDRSDKLIKQLVNLFQVENSSTDNSYMLPILTLAINSSKVDSNVDSVQQQKYVECNILKINEFLFCSAKQSITPFEELDPTYLTSFK